MSSRLFRALRVAAGVSVSIASLAAPALLLAQTTRYPLTSAAGLQLHNVAAEPATLQGQRGLKVTMAGSAPAGGAVEQLAVIDGPPFGDGTIEVEVAGDVRAGAAEGARGFVGIAFRVQSDRRTYDAFYLRPTNGRADDQVRRNHAAQYISHPDWPWSRLRTEFPSKYEAYVDLLPGTWTPVKIEVRGSGARLYVHGQAQPTLVVNDLKTGAGVRGAVALWLDVGTVAHFRNLTVSP